MLIRAIKFKAYPTEEQIKKINHNIWSCRYIWNKLLEYCQCNNLTQAPYDEYQAILNSEPVIGADTTALDRKYNDLNRTLKLYSQKYIPRVKFKSALETNFKGRRYTTKIESFTRDGFILPGMGLLKASITDKLPLSAKVYFITIIIYKDNAVYLTVNYQYEKELLTPTLDISKSIGLDYNLKHIYVDSNGHKACDEWPFKDSLHKYMEEKHKLDLLPYGKQEYLDQERRTAYYYRRSENIRQEFYRRLAAELTDNYDYIFIEDLRILDFDQSCVATSNALAWFDFVEYLVKKAELKGKQVIKIDHYFPSSKMCSVCGYIKHDLLISDKEWTCKCGAVHNRDVNSAQNILNRGISLVAGGHRD